jgi:hypothetical protein
MSQFLMMYDDFCFIEDEVFDYQLVEIIKFGFYSHNLTGGFVTILEVY